MALLESFRKRFTNNLESHQIDDDYTLPSRHNASSTSISLNGSSNGTNGTHRNNNNDGTNDISYNGRGQFDPDETVPSYETSQYLHQHQYGSHHLHQQPHSIPPSTHISRNSSLVSTDIVFGDAHYSAIPLPPSLTASLPLSSPPSIPPPPPPPAQHLAPPIPTSSSAIVANSRKNEYKKSSLKQLGLKFLNARQHFALALSRDVSLLPPLIGLVQSWKRLFDNKPPVIDENQELVKSLTSARVSEHFLTGLWCIVAAYLSYSVLDGLIIRWIVIYSTPAAIVRVLSMSAIIMTAEQYLVSSFSANGYKYGLHIWILISCCLTLAYIVQNFVTSNIELKKSNSSSTSQSHLSNSGSIPQDSNTIPSQTGSSSTSTSSSTSATVSYTNGSVDYKARARFFDFYNIVVFAVVPVGLASFITMIGLLRSLLILRIDIDESFSGHL
ncbi:N-glycosylation protein-domain-containing protein [Scheffersomyces amazonensis]|uniref:N-glycosylation protein-domain-containing protein n=1 Tax=Scheffersomyces amazonensis TaxID=1078765 RepID=UPI00315DFBE0